METLGLLESEDSGYQKSIQRKILEKINGNSFPWAYFILIVSAFVDFHIFSIIEEFPRDEKIGYLLAFALFNGLDSDKNVYQRRTTAQIIAKHLPIVQYLPAVVNCMSTEVNDTVKKYLHDYLDRQPPGAFYDFFTKADLHTRTQISNNKEMLLKLLKEPSEESCLFALESLAKFPPEKVMSIFLSFVDNKNSNIRAKTLELIIKSKNKDTQVVEVFAKVLCDTSPEIRLLALEFIEQAKEKSCIPQVFALLQSEQNEIVKEKAVTTLGNLKDAKVIPYLLKLLMDNNQKIRTLALSSLERNIELMEMDVKKLFNLIRKVTKKKCSLGIRDTIFLRKFSRKYPEMGGVVQTLKKISREHS